MYSLKWLAPNLIFMVSLTFQIGAGAQLALDDAERNQIKDDPAELKVTTTLDPISEILANVEILDVNAYIPEGYTFDHQEESDPELENVVDNLESETLLSEEEKDNIPKVKPGKLNGKKLAAMTKQLEIDKSNEEKEDRAGKGISGASLEFSAESIFASILNGEEVKLKPAEESVSSTPPKEVSTTSTTSLPSTTTTTTSTTTSPPKSTTPGVCGKYCSLAGTIFVKSGLDWSEELLYAYSEVYEEVTEEVVNEMTKVFENVYFGNAFEFASVEAYSRQGETVLVDFYVQFGGIVFNVDTKDIKDSVRELTEVVDSKKNMFGKFEIDLNSTYFIVVDTSSPLERIGAENPDATLLPEWAWLVVVVGIVSTFIVGFFGVIMGVQRYRHNQVLKTKVLNPKTLQQFRGQKHFDEVDVDIVTAYATDKRDMWTIQKTQQRAELAKSLNKKSCSKDSGQGSSIRSSFGKGFYERFPSLGKGLGKRKFNPNDSNAELLGGNDSTCLDDSRDIIESTPVDPRLKTGAELFVQQPNSSILVPSLTAQDNAGYDSDCSSVSDGPSETI